MLRGYKPSETLLAGQVPLLLETSLKCKLVLSAHPLHLSLQDKCFRLAADPLEFGVRLADRLVLSIAGCLFAFGAISPLLVPICFLQLSRRWPQLYLEINQHPSAHWRVRGDCFPKELPE